MGSVLVMFEPRMKMYVCLDQCKNLHFAKIIIGLEMPSTQLLDNSAYSVYCAYTKSPQGTNSAFHASLVFTVLLLGPH